MPAVRPRLLLTLLDALGGEVGTRDFQKLLFLYTQEWEEIPSFDFVPLKYGGFSFTSHADRRRLVVAELLQNDDETWRITAAGRRAAVSKGKERLLLDRFSRAHRELRGEKLVAHAYKKHPYYAIRSEIIESVLHENADRALVMAARPTPRSAGLVTIGYEGKSLESYLNQLLKDAVTRLCDVRRNPISRKYGFSKATLSKACEGVGIKYEHLPELGIASDKRRELNSQADYDILFSLYEREHLPKQTSAIAKIVEWIEDGERVALTCYELKPCQCHRHCIADSLDNKRGRKFTPLHL